jgi:hypothetical protein
MNIKKLGNTPSFPSVIYLASSDQWFRSYEILRIDNTAKTVLDRSTMGRNKILETKLN